MTRVLVTVDTELAYGMHRKGLSPAENFDRFVLGSTPRGDVGLTYQAREFDRHGIKAVFFVEAMASAALGDDYLRRIVDVVLSHGHEVQLHVHPEWIQAMERSPVTGTGTMMRHFSLADQCVLIDVAANALVNAGAPVPTAFRAGAFGANEDTLAALSRAGMHYDSSLNAAMPQTCALVGTDPDSRPGGPAGTLDEVAVTCFEDRPGHLRPLQLCAVSAGEMQHVLTTLAVVDEPRAVVVAHSFELLDGARRFPSRRQVDRFRRLCEFLADRRESLVSAGFSGLARSSSPPRRVRSGIARTARRMVEQAIDRLVH